MPEITRTKTSGTRTRPSGVKDARRGWREAACRQPSWREEWEERKSGRLRTSVLSNLILMRTKADEWESGKNLPTKKANKITKNKTSKNNNCSTYKMRQKKTKNKKMQNRTVSCVELLVVPGRPNKKHVPTSECSSTAVSTTGKVFAAFWSFLLLRFATWLRTKTENWHYHIKGYWMKQHAYVHSSSRLTEKGWQELHKSRATRWRRGKTRLA